MSHLRFALIALAVAGAVMGSAELAGSEYLFFAGYVVLQYIVLATAWNILGGYAGYVNFGTAAFFAIGAYLSAVLHKIVVLPVPAYIVLAGLLCGGLGLGVGYLTLRLRGVYFSIATLALSVVAQTMIVNWGYAGGSRGIFVTGVQEGAVFGGLVRYLCFLMLLVAVFAVAIARGIEQSRLGFGLAAIRDDEAAAEAAGVPSLRLKLIATTLSGGLMGMAGAPQAFYVSYLDPASAFNLAYTVNSVAMPIIGGMTSWVGPIIGAILLATIQQVATVTISSAANLLIVGVLLVVFVVAAPRGICGLVPGLRGLATRGARDAEPKAQKLGRKGPPGGLR